MKEPRKFERCFSDGLFGLADLPAQLSLKLQAQLESRAHDGRPGREERRSWKRRRKNRWRAK